MSFENLDIKSFQTFEYQTFVSSTLWSSTARGCMHVSTAMKGATQISRRFRSWGGGGFKHLPRNNCECSPQHSKLLNDICHKRKSVLFEI